MRVLLLSLLLGAVLLAQQITTVQPMSDAEDNHIIAQIALEDACRLGRFNCDGLEVPQVRTSPQMERMRLNGVYLGGTALYINDSLLPARKRLTIFHEIVHYLQIQAIGSNPAMINRQGSCILEREAMELSNQYADEIGATVLKRDLEEWYKGYRC
jgi:Zn-dependent peptidase ImmA (M78 family)